jgi:hypothetical protein
MLTFRPRRDWAIAPGGCLLAEEIQDRDADGGRDAFDRAEGQIPLSTFDATKIGAVYAERVREFFLAFTPIDSEATQVAAKHMLQVAFHASNGG